MQNDLRGRTQKAIFVFLIFYTLCSVGFFSPAFVDMENYVLYLYAAVNLVLLPSVLHFYIKREPGYLFAGALKLFNIAVFISILCAYFYWNQSLRDSFLAALFPAAGYNLYFYMAKRKVSAAMIERIIFIVGGFSVIIFFLSFILFPMKLFTNSYTNEEFDRGFQRIQLAGFGFIYLFFFMVLNKATVSEEKRLKWIVITAITYVCIILSLTRTYIAFTTLIAAIYLFRSSKFYMKALMILLVIGLSFVLPQLPFIKNMTETTKDNISEAKDYIRIQGAQFFLTDFQPSDVTRVLGNGFSYGEKSDYGKYLVSLQKTDFFYIEDLGLVGLYIYIGAIGLFAFGLIFFKAMIEKLRPELVYPKMFIAFIILTGLNSYATYSTTFLVAIVFALYQYEANRDLDREEENTIQTDSDSLD